jgi:hypothetical protein
VASRRDGRSREERGRRNASTNGGGAETTGRMRKSRLGRGERPTCRVALLQRGPKWIVMSAVYVLNSRRSCVDGRLHLDIDALSRPRATRLRRNLSREAQASRPADTTHEGIEIGRALSRSGIRMGRRCEYVSRVVAGAIFTFTCTFQFIRKLPCLIALSRVSSCCGQRGLLYAEHS